MKRKAFNFLVCLSERWIKISRNLLVVKGLYKSPCVHLCPKSISSTKSANANVILDINQMNYIPRKGNFVHKAYQGMTQTLDRNWNLPPKVSFGQ